MRTTLTLENDLAEKLKGLAHQRHISFKQIVNDTLRSGLAVDRKPAKARRPFRVKPSHCGFRPGVDLGKLNQIVDEIEAEDFRREWVQDS